MKNFILPFAFLLMFYSLFLTDDLHAQVIVINSNELQKAINDAPSGAFIYVYGEGYGNITINKKITLIGEGYYNGDPTTAPIIKNIILEKGTNDNPSGSFITGLKIDSISIRDTPNGEVILERCRIGDVNLFNFSVFTLRQSVIKKVYLNNNIDGKLIITNNIFESGELGSLYGFDTNNGDVTISNNLFIRPRGATKTSFTIYNNFLKNVTLANNIFYGVNAYNGSNVACTFNNNIAYEIDNGASFIASGTDNIIADPKFMKIEPGRFTLEFDDDYHLAVGSPGIGKGTNESDIGIYGGSNPFPEDLTGAPRIPQIDKFEIPDPVVQKDEPLIFHLQGTANP